MGEDGGHDRPYPVKANPIKKRSIDIARHRTSVSVEEPFWDTLKALARKRGISVSDIIAGIDSKRNGSLSGAVRLYVLKELRKEVKL